MYLVQVQTCKSCTSDDGSNVDCEEDPESFPSTKCDPDFGDDFCFAMVTKDMLGPGGSTIWRWNSKRAFHE